MTHTPSPAMKAAPPRLEAGPLVSSERPYGSHLRRQLHCSGDAADDGCDARPEVMLHRVPLTIERAQGRPGAQYTRSHDERGVPRMDVLARNRAFGMARDSYLGKAKIVGYAREAMT